MANNDSLPVVLLNGPIVTTNGVYALKDLDIQTAKNYIGKYGYVSAIGHEATAEVMSELLGVNISMNRIQFYQQPGQIAIVFKLNERPPEGTILTKVEIKDIGYVLKEMKRIE